MGTQFQKTALAIVAILVVGYLGYRLYMGQGLTGGDEQSPNSPATVSSTPLGGGTARTPTPQPTQASGAAATVMTAINTRRTSEKVTALPANAILQREAQRLADDMAKNGYLDHTDSTGATFTERMAASGYASGNVAENIGITSRTSGTDVVSNWDDFFYGASGKHARSQASCDRCRCCHGYVSGPIGDFCRRNLRRPEIVFLLHSKAALLVEVVWSIKTVAFDQFLLLFL